MAKNTDPCLTMKIALIADCHGNLPALNHVLKHASQQGVQQIWNLGDFLGYSPYPEQIVEKIRKKKILSIIGNYDLKVLDFSKKKSKWKGSKYPAKFFSFQWTYDHITPKTRKYLKKLPQELRLTVRGIKFLLVHGSPEGIDDPLGPATPLLKFRRIAKNTTAQVILCGHTHYFFSKMVNGVQFINPGSVGRPFDSDARASYAILEIQNGKVRATNYRIKYPVVKVLRKMRSQHFPNEIIQSIAEGKSIDQLYEN